MIFVTKPFLPSIDEYQKYLTQIWDSNILTNNGQLVSKLEQELKLYFNSKNLLYTSNGTISLQIAIKALDLGKAEIITTPFSYVATTSCIVWENCTPVFADIEEDTFNISPEAIENKITKHTKAILTTHVFGNPSNIDKIEKIAKAHNLVVIYDAAHCFGTEYKGESVLNYGDVSSISFHATKLFHTIEGGALISKSDDLIKKMSLMRNFGHDGFDKYKGVGINGKNSEYHAAMGLCNLKHVSNILENRKHISDYYDQYISKFDLGKQKIDLEKVKYNYSYYPIVCENETMLLKIKEELEKNQIFSRRYFFPSLNLLDYVQYERCVNSESLSSKILCLPIYYGLKDSEIEMICKIVKNTIHN